MRSNPNYANCPPVIFSVLWSLHRLCKYRHRISFVHKIEFSSETRGILLEGGSCSRDNTGFKQEKVTFFLQKRESKNQFTPSKIRKIGICGMHYRLNGEDRNA